jgi:hypothetical protein
MKKIWNWKNLQVKLLETLKKSKSFEVEVLINSHIEVTDATFNKTVQRHTLVEIDCQAA